MSNKYNIIDLFCGIGGLSYGFKKEGFNILAGIDFDNSCKYAYEKNNKATFLHKNLITIDSEEISSLFPKDEIKILVGCAPCQAFSAYSKNKETNDKWKLLYSFSRIINETQPDIISMENVPNLLKYDNGKVFKDFINNLEKNNYHISYSVVNAQNYGVPQRRNRLLLFASKLGKIDIINETHSKRKVTVRQAIGNLPPIEDGEVCETDLLHRTRKLSPMNKKRITATPLGGSWKDWDESLILDCHKKDSGKTFSSVYGRMKWNDVSPTLTTQCTGLGNGRFGHPEQNRAISLREAALLQSFPKNYKFIDPNLPISTVSLVRQIGNAVPVKLGQVVAKTIKLHIEKNTSK